MCSLAGCRQRAHAVRVGALVDRLQRAWSMGMTATCARSSGKTVRVSALVSSICGFPKAAVAPVYAVVIVLVITGTPGGRFRDGS